MAGKEWLGAINVGNTVGGINWPGAAFDPETAIFYGQANNSSVTTESISEAYLTVVNPETQETLYESGTLLDEDMVDEIERLGIDEVRVRTR